MKNLIEIKNLTVNYILSKNEKIYAIQNIDLNIKKGETVAIVGESGSGKSTLANSIIKLFPENVEYSGSIKIEGEEILDKNNTYLQKIRGEKVGMIFQEPGASLNPVFSIKEQIEETIKTHKKIFDKKVLKQISLKLLKEVGVKEAERVYYSYPHQLSGGLQQRVMIAIALSCSPQILIADEPTTSLDVTIQAQIIELLRNLIKTRKLTTILITHDLHLAKEIAERIIVLYAGQIVEDGKIFSLKEAKHPYTRALFEIVPNLKSTSKKFKIIPGELPDMKKVFEKCGFIERCKYKKEECNKNLPKLKKIKKNHWVKCFYPL